MADLMKMAACQAEKLVKNGQDRVLRRLVECVNSGLTLDVSDFKESDEHMLLHLVWRRLSRKGHRVSSNPEEAQENRNKSLLIKAAGWGSPNLNDSSRSGGESQSAKKAGMLPISPLSPVSPEQEPVGERFPRTTSDGNLGSTEEACVLPLPYPSAVPPNQEFVSPNQESVGPPAECSCVFSTPLKTENRFSALSEEAPSKDLDDFAAKMARSYEIIQKSEREVKELEAKNLLLDKKLQEIEKKSARH